jgi:hypothetical protein
MPCQIHVEVEVQADILGLSANARREIGEFLLRLQDDPLPAERIELAPRPPGAFFQALSCGYWISWEILGDPMRFALKGETEGLIVRVPGVAAMRPA